jgi:hypothetical protein
VLKVAPEMGFAARANQAFLGRTVRYLTGQAGIRQFPDIGTGIATAGNTHQVAQAVAPESLVVYADNDPIVLLHAKVLLADSPESCCEDARQRGVSTRLGAPAGWS